VEKPKLTLFELLNVTALIEALLAPALIFTLPCVDATVTEAVMTELPERPKETLLLFEKVMAERLRLDAPALTKTFVSEVAMEAVIVPTPAPVNSPNDTLFELLNVIALSAFDVPPFAETFSAWLAVIVPTPAPVLRPKDTPLEFENVRADSAAELAPPLTVMLPWLLATEAEAVRVPALTPKETLFEFEKTTLLLLPKSAPQRWPSPCFRWCRS
jgi:hypothetical protein